MRISVAFLALGLLACDSPTLPQERALELAAARWDAAHITDYDMEISVGCFCPPELTGWARVRVVSGAVVRVIGLPDSTVYPEQLWPMWPTINEIFGQLQAARGSSTYRGFNATFNPEFGYPEAASLISRPEIQDAGITWQIRLVEPLASVAARVGGVGGNR